MGAILPRSSRPAFPNQGSVNGDFRVVNVRPGRFDSAAGILDHASPAGLCPRSRPCAGFGRIREIVKIREFVGVVGGYEFRTEGEFADYVERLSPPFRIRSIGRFRGAFGAVDRSFPAFRLAGLAGGRRRDRVGWVAGLCFEGPDPGFQFLDFAPRAGAVGSFPSVGSVGMKSTNIPFSAAWGSFHAGEGRLFCHHSILSFLGSSLGDQNLEVRRERRNNRVPDQAFRDPEYPGDLGEEESPIVAGAGGARGGFLYYYHLLLPLWFLLGSG